MTMGEIQGWNQTRAGYEILYVIAVMQHLLLTFLL